MVADRHDPPGTLLDTAVLGHRATIIGHGLQYYLLQRYTVNSVAPFITLSTLFAIVFGVVLLDDDLTPRILIGGALTLLGVTIVAVRNARENAPVACACRDRWGRTAQVGPRRSGHAGWARAGRAA